MKIMLEHHVDNNVYKRIVDTPHRDIPFTLAVEICKKLNTISINDNTRNYFVVTNNYLPQDEQA